MKITAVDVFPVRQFTYVKITTEDGLYGLGEASLSGRYMAVAHAFDHLTPLLIGQDATRIEHTFSTLPRWPTDGQRPEAQLLVQGEVAAAAAKDDPRLTV